MRQRHYLLLILGTISVIMGWLSNVHLHWDWLSSLFTNFGAAFIAAFLIVLLIDRALEKERQARSEKFQKFVLSSLRPTFLRYLDFLCTWYKAASTSVREPRPDRLDKLFDDNYYDQIRYLDFSKDAQVYPKTD